MAAHERSSCAGPGLRPLHVMFLVHGFEIGGLENVVAHLINHCDQERFRFSVCAMTQLGNARLRVRRADTRYYALNKPPGNNWSLILRIALILKDDPVDIIQTHEWGTYLEGLLSAWLARVPVCIHVEQGTPNWELWRQRLVYRITRRMVDRFVPVSAQLRKDMIDHLNLDPHKVQLISNAIETGQFVRAPNQRERLRAALGVTRTDFLLGSVGRLVSVKGYDTLLRAVALLKNQGRSVRLILIGQGPLYQSLQNLARSLAVDPHVFFLGERSDIADLLSTLDAYVSSSLSEGRSLSIMEAMASALPVVATSVGGTPEILSDGETGLLVPPSDPEALCAALGKLIDDAPQRVRLGAAARQRAVAAFDVKRMVDNYQQLYLSRWAQAAKV